MSIIRSSWLSLGLGKAGGELDVAPLRDGGIDIGMTHNRLAGSVRFTLHPAAVDNSWSGGAGMYMCGELLLCPTCAAKRERREEE